VLCGEEVRWLSNLEVVKKLVDYKEEIDQVLQDGKVKVLVEIADPEFLTFVADFNQIISSL
jgi:hypothetical protein